MKITKTEPTFYTGVLEKKIPRGRINHTILAELSCLIKAFFCNLNDSKKIEKFESDFAEYNERKFCVAFPYARTALYFALKARGLKPGDEIIMPPITIKAMLDVILSLDLRPVFVDIDADTLCFNEKELALAVSDKTKAVLVTYLFGMVPNIKNLISLLDKSKIYIIEDFSQCLNGKYENRLVGSFGDLGIYSASSTKQLDLFGGGLVVCNDRKLAGALKKFQSGLFQPSRWALIKKIMLNLVRNAATSPLIFDFFTFPAIRFISLINSYHVIKFVGDRSRDRLYELPKSWFYKFTSLQASFGISQLKNISHVDSMRLGNVTFIKNNAATRFKFLDCVPATNNVYWQLIMYVKDPILAQSSLRKYGIDSATSSLIEISSLDKYPFIKSTPNAKRLLTNGLFIPCFAQLNMNEIQRIVRVLRYCEKELT